MNPGNDTSIDQILSAPTGFVPRLDDRHARSRIHCGTLYINHVSTISFTHLQCSTVGIKTIAATHLYELFAVRFGVIIKAYHADKGFLLRKRLGTILTSSIR